MRLGRADVDDHGDVGPPGGHAADGLGVGQVVARRFDPRDGGAAAQGAADHQQAQGELVAHAVVADGRSQRGVDEGDAQDRELRHADDPRVKGRGWPLVREPRVTPDLNRRCLGSQDASASSRAG
jgi:hypothetical protein